MKHPISPLKVLVAPLDWGLGHATRCIPVIRSLLAANCLVFIAASGKVKALLEMEFPFLPIQYLPGYNITYASNSWGLLFKIVAQIPRIISAIKQEQLWLQKVVQEEQIDVVISDNRYGLYHPAIISVFITHQLRIKAPWPFIEIILQKLNYHFINKYSACWVLDAPTSNNLAGDLSHPVKKPVTHLQYIGGISRFQKKEAELGRHLLIILSGPEPQRTLLENIVVSDLKTFTDPVILVRGLPQTKETILVQRNITVYNHLPSAELERNILEATFIISRCGYSTVMDLAVMQKKSILIPTPGQTEQQYLAKHLMKKNFALCIEQKKFRLKAALSFANQFRYEAFPFIDETYLHEAIHQLITSVKK